MPTHALLSLAEPLGRLLAGVASVPLDGANVASISLSTALGTAAEHLRRERTQARLGRALAGELRARFETAASRLVSADRARGLAHGDFGGRNVIVAPAGGDDWRVAALLDWEQSFVGATLWDVGSLFRYARRYTATFRDRFALGYRDAGGALTDDWYVTARLLDATRVVGILSAGRELPTVFAECREAIEALVSEG
jgi:aminoglycoside phosphotransferase (APT) family kinase protein